MRKQKPIIGGIAGVGDADKFFLIVVREGDEIGQYMVEEDAGFMDVAREIARVDITTRRWLEEHEQGMSVFIDTVLPILFCIALVACIVQLSRIHMRR